MVIFALLQAAASKALHPESCQPSITRLPVHSKTAATTHNRQQSAGKRVVVGYHMSVNPLEQKVAFRKRKVAQLSKVQAS